MSSFAHIAQTNGSLSWVVFLAEQKRLVGNQKRSAGEDHGAATDDTAVFAPYLNLAYAWRAVPAYVLIIRTCGLLHYQGDSTIFDTGSFRVS
jgi:hypothetical protein